MLGSATVRVHGTSTPDLPACLRLKFSSCTAAQEDRRRQARLFRLATSIQQRHTLLDRVPVNRGMPGDGTRLNSRRPQIPIRRPMLKTPPTTVSSLTQKHAAERVAGVGPRSRHSRA